MINPDLFTDIHAHQKICHELLALCEQECQALRHNQRGDLEDVYRKRRGLVPALQSSVERIWQHRLARQQVVAAERLRTPEVDALIRQTQDLIMRAIVLDRENEQGLLRRGWVPAHEVALVTAPRPHQVTTAYRQGVSQW